MLSNQAAGMIFPRGWDSRLVGRARCPDRPFQLLVDASGRRAQPCACGAENFALACRPRYLPESSHRATLEHRWEGARPVTVGASLASHNTLWNHAALSVLEGLRGELSPAKCHQAIGRVN
jgi:hypothetical protein